MRGAGGIRFGSFLESRNRLSSRGDCKKFKPEIKGCLLLSARHCHRSADIPVRSERRPSHRFTYVLKASPPSDVAADRNVRAPGWWWYRAPGFDWTAGEPFSKLNGRMHKYRGIWAWVAVILCSLLRA